MGFEDWPFIGTRGKRLRRLLEQAAEPALEQIRRDRDRPQPIQPMRDAFEYLERNIFSSELTVDRLFKVTRVKDSKAFQSFQAITGLTPHAYIEQRRLETAAGLILLDKNLILYMIAAAVGYETMDSFRRAFQRWAGQAPGLFQERVWKLKSAGVRGPEPVWFTRRWAERYETGSLADHEREVALAWLRAAYGLESQEAGSTTARVTRERYEQRWAVAFWRLLRRLPVKDVRALVMAAPFETPVFLEHLCEQSRDEGRDDRRRGVAVAELALAALEPLAKHVTEPVWSRCQAKVWACLGNARWRALDDEGAEDAFAAAERFLAVAEPPAELRAELLFFRSCHGFAQRRLNEALELAESALALLENRTGRLVAEILILRAQVFAHLGQTERAIPDLHAALSALDVETEPYVAWVIHQNLASAFWRLGRPEEVTDWLARARPLAAALGKLSPWCHTLWLEGLLADQRGRPETAAARLREACEAWRGIREWGFFAVAALDLARVEERRGEAGEAVRWATQSLPHLEALKLEREGSAALALLRRELTARQLTGAVLAELRRTTGRAVGAPELSLSSEPR